MKPNSFNPIPLLSRGALTLDPINQERFASNIKILEKNIDKRPTELLKEKNLKDEFKRNEESTVAKKVSQYIIIKSILSKEKITRTKPEIKLLSNYMCDKYLFFRKLREHSDNDKLEACLKVLNYESVKTGINLIHFNDLGQKFYIVLNGRVGIFKHKLIEEEMYEREFVEYLHKIKYLEKNENKLRRVEEKNMDHLFLAKLYDYDPSKINNNNRKIYNIEIEEKITEKTNGEEFGEISLVQRIKTTATVRTITDCDIAYISKNDYNHIIREIEEKKFHSKIEDFKKNFSILDKWNKQNLIKLMTSFTKLAVNKNEILYEQYSEPDYIYFIINGVYEMSTYFSLENCNDYLEYIKCEKGNLSSHLSKAVSKYSDMLNIVNNYSNKCLIRKVSTISFLNVRRLPTQ
jgi:CRP-like cAMP-binding protein